MKTKKLIPIVLLSLIFIAVAVTSLVYKVDPSACTNCGLCIEVCPTEAISEMEVEGKLVAVIDPSLCIGCGLCSEVCPVEAISDTLFSDTTIIGEVTQ